MVILSFLVAGRAEDLNVMATLGEIEKKKKQSKTLNPAIRLIDVLI